MDEKESRYYQLCRFTRGGDGVNKYYRTIGQYITSRRYKFSKIDYTSKLTLQKFINDVEKLNKGSLTLNKLVQSGTKKHNLGSSKGFTIDKDDAQAMLRSKLKKYLQTVHSQENDANSDDDYMDQDDDIST
eukprot:495451_1